MISGRLSRQNCAYTHNLLRRFVHKLTYSYGERNALITNADYPLYKTPANRAEISSVLERFREIKHTPLADPNIDSIECFGRVKNVRKSGKNLTFIDLEYNRASIQVVVNFKKLDITDNLESIKLLRKGDSISIKGKPWRSPAGELSILASQVPQLQSACLHPPPTADISEAIKRSNRVAELKTFAGAREVLYARDTIISAITTFLKARGFTQVQTPILSSQLGGANAEPFITESGPALRVAPELWLKRMIIGGFDRVFEIGPSFRNEGIDSTHNPEFTTCELYQSFSNLDDLIELTKQMLGVVIQEVQQKHPFYTVPEFNWNVVDFYTELEARSGKQVPETISVASLSQYLNDVGLKVEEGATVSKMLDKLAGHFIEDNCTDATFIINPPALLAPLAKQTTLCINGINREVSRRFELIIEGREYVNAYEEENDPKAQLEKLKLQAKDQSQDSVADIDYVRDMEWGLPPTGGWGMGIDRLVMLFTQSIRISQVLSFGAMRQVAKTKEDNDESSQH